MTDDQIKQQIAARLDIQNLHDLRSVMNTVEGRRFFSWLIMRCGQNETSFTRDSRTYFNEGMRNVALLLESSVKALGLSGVDLLHKSEREYIAYQMDLKLKLKKGEQP